MSNDNEQPPVTPQSDSETPKQSSSEGAPTHGGKREGAGAPEKKPPRKKSYNRFWMSIANQMNKLCIRISKEGGFPITENSKKETVGELIDAVNLINELLKGARL